MLDKLDIWLSLIDIAFCTIDTVFIVWFFIHHLSSDQKIDTLKLEIESLKWELERKSKPISNQFKKFYRKNK